VTRLKAKGLLSFPGARSTTADFPRFFTCIRFLFSYNEVPGWPRQEVPNVKGDCGFFR
jgi:hypothetical protein